MTNQIRAGIVLIAVLSLCLLAGSAMDANGQAPASGSKQKETPVTKHAKGMFEVKLTPQASDYKGEGVPLGRMSFDKQFHGDLEGTSQGEMLTAGSVAKGSAGYVAIERVTGTLNGRTGTFTLQHSGTMN